MATLEELVLKISADVSGLKAGFATAASSSQKTAKDMEGHFGKVGGALTSLKNLAVGFAATIGIAVGVVAFKQFVVGSMQSVDAMAKLSDKMGIAIESLYGLQVLAADTGVEFGTLTGSITKMMKEIQNAAGQSPALQKGFRNLQIDAANLKNERPEEAFKKIADAFAGVTNQGERTTAMMAIFGRSGKEIDAIIRAGSEGMNRAALMAKELGYSLSRIEAAKVEEANDAIERIGFMLKGVGQVVAQELSPIITGIAAKFQEAATSTDGFRTTVSSAVKSSVEGVAFLANTIKGLQIVWAYVELGAAKVAEGINIGMVHASRAVLGLANIVVNFKDLILEVGDLIGASFSAAWALVKLGVGELVSFVGSQMARMMYSIADVTHYVDKDLAQSMQDAATRMSKDSSEFTEGLKKDFAGAARDVSYHAQQVKNAWAGILDTEGKGDGIKQYFEGAAKSSTDAVAIAKANLDALLAVPPPSEGIKQWVAEVTAAAQKAGEAVAAVAPGGSGEGGKKELSAYEENLKIKSELLKASLDEKVLMEEERYTADQELIQEQFEAGMLSKAEHDLALQNAEQDHVDRIRDINAKAIIDRKGMFQAETINRIATAGQMFGQLASLANSNNKKLVAIGKAARYAETIMNTAAAAMACFNQGSQQGGPYLGAAYAAIAIAAGAVQLANINSANTGGGGSISAPGGSVPAIPQQKNGETNGQSQKASNNMTLQINDDTNGRASLEALAEKLKELERNGIIVDRITVQ